MRLFCHVILTNSQKTARWICRFAAVSAPLQTLAHLSTEALATVGPNTMTVPDRFSTACRPRRAGRANGTHHAVDPGPPRAGTRHCADRAGRVPVLQSWRGSLACRASRLKDRGYFHSNINRLEAGFGQVQKAAARRRGKAARSGRTRTGGLTPADCRAASPRYAGTVRGRHPVAGATQGRPRPARPRSNLSGPMACPLPCLDAADSHPKPLLGMIGGEIAVER